jgi:hypothetical protein
MKLRGCRIAGCCDDGCCMRLDGAGELAVARRSADVWLLGLAGFWPAVARRSADAWLLGLVSLYQLLLIKGSFR